MRSECRSRRPNVVQRMENVRIASTFSGRCRTIDIRQKKKKNYTLLTDAMQSILSYFNRITYRLCWIESEK